MTTVHCPALLISAPASGQGKTTVTAALARHHRRQGRRVRVFKTGPDFLDPMILQQAAGSPVYQLDLWMAGEAHCRQLLFEAAREADLILIEGVMGLYDGTPSSADLARLFNIPVLAVIDAKAMGQTFGALAHGLAHYRDIPFAGVMANRIASDNHLDMVRESLPAGMTFFGALPREAFCELPHRHLGLVQAAEVAELDSKLDQMAEAIARSAACDLPQPVAFTAAQTETPAQTLQGVTIAVARDLAFSFVYPANLDLLRRLGAELVFFSPLHDAVLPQADSLYLPGGYPELFLDELHANATMREAIIAHHRAGKPLVAECGGMLYLLDSLTDHQGKRRAMLGLLPGEARLQDKLSNLGMHAVSLPQGELRGHTYHHSSLQTSVQPIAHSQPARKRGKAEPVFYRNNLLASYLHLYLPSNPEAAARLFLPAMDIINSYNDKTVEEIPCI